MAKKILRFKCGYIFGSLCKVYLPFFFLLAMAGPATAENGIVLRQEDFVTEVGTRTVYAADFGDGNPLMKYENTTVESIHLGDVLLNKIVTKFGDDNSSYTWWVISPDRLQAYSQGMSKGPSTDLPLPLKVGDTGGVDKSEKGTSFLVEKEESLTLPGGTYQCLVLVLSQDGAPFFRMWIAPGVGFVMTKRLGKNPQKNMFISRQMIKPAALPAKETMLVDFEPDFASAAAFSPRTRWKTNNTDQAGRSYCDIDTREAAAKTMASLRWSYHTKGQLWVQVDVLPTGSWNERFDLTVYDSVSFYIKGFRSGQCFFMVHGQPVREGGETWVNIPIEYTTEWKKVTVNLHRPELGKLDLRKAAQVGLGYLGKENDDNVIWIDEIVCHK